MEGASHQPKMNSSHLHLNLGEGGRRLMPHVTTRQPLISPITRGDIPHNFVMFTEPRGGGPIGGVDGVNFTCSVASNGSGGDSEGTRMIKEMEGFPCPATPEAEEDPGEILSQGLNTLFLARKTEEQKIRLCSGGKKKPKDKQAGAKEEEPAVKIDYDKDTFTVVNSEAANHALYMIFSVVDAKETEERFRHCWPVYEKKLEGQFRRLALDWIKQLVEENPLFFREVSCNAIGGLLVTPGGDRFIHFMRSLARFALFCVANRNKSLIKQQVLLPPESRDDQEIYNRQLHVVQCRSRQAADKVKEKYTRMCKLDLIMFQQKRSRDESREKLKHQVAIDREYLYSLVKDHPDVFGNPTDEQLKQREEQIKETKLIDIFERDECGDILRDSVETALKLKAESINKPVSLLSNMMEDFGKLWHILELDTSEPTAVLDGSKLGNAASLNELLEKFGNAVEKVMTLPILNTETPEDVRKEFEDWKNRINFLKIMRKEIEKSHGDTSFVNQAEIQLPALKKSMDNRDWSWLSKVKQDTGVGRLLDITTFQRGFDINKVSGRTPGIQNFLDSSSSDEHNLSMASQAAVVRRRCVNLKKTGKLNMETAIRVPEDTTDGGKEAAEEIDEEEDDHKAPLSSTQIHPSMNVSLARSCYFRDSIAGTPASPVRSANTSSSSRIRKSVSFGETPSSSFNSSVISVRRPVQRKTDSYATRGEGEEMIEGNSVNMSRSGLSLSFASSTGTPVVGLDSSTQERVNRLLESVANMKKDKSLEGSCSGDEDKEGAAAGEENKINGNSREEKEDAEVVLLESSVDKGAGIVAEVMEMDFGSSAIMEDFEDVKGIMETSYCEYFRNSDSDD